MKPPKDLFSEQAGNYRRFRPSYPQELIRDVASLAPARGRALDCATGNGQVARALATYFDKVEAIDISGEQIGLAPRVPNVTYHIRRAEETGFQHGSFDLICVAQGIHWFDLPAFHREAKRLLVPGGILAVWGYGLLRSDPGTDAWLDRFYNEITGPYWEPERRYIDTSYRDLPFPWKEVKMPGSYAIRREVAPEDIAGYLYSWSATRQMLRVREDPLPGWMESLREIWGPVQNREARHEIFMRVGRKDQ